MAILDFAADIYKSISSLKDYGVGGANRSRLLTRSVLKDAVTLDLVQGVSRVVDRGVAVFDWLLRPLRCDVFLG